MATKRKGQAMIELAIGLVAIVLVVSAVVRFAEYIIDDLARQAKYRPQHRSMFLKFI